MHATAIIRLFRQKLNGIHMYVLGLSGYIRLIVILNYNLTTLLLIVVEYC